MIYEMNVVDMLIEVRTTVSHQWRVTSAAKFWKLKLSKPWIYSHPESFGHEVAWSCKKNVSLQSMDPFRKQKTKTNCTDPPRRGCQANRQLPACRQSISGYATDTRVVVLTLHLWKEGESCSTRESLRNVTCVTKPGKSMRWPRVVKRLVLPFVPTSLAKKTDVGNTPGLKEWFVSGVEYRPPTICYGSWP